MVPTSVIATATPHRIATEYTSGEGGTANYHYGRAVPCFAFSVQRSALSPDTPLLPQEPIAER